MTPIGSKNTPSSVSPSFRNVLNKARTAIRDFNMIQKGDRILIGLSGGKDSVVLLYTLNMLSSEYGFELTAVHVNHGIRGNEAMRDQLFCIDLCKKLSVDIEVISVDAPKYAKENGLGLEEAARILRYLSFNGISEKRNTNKTATAHTSSDNLETVIFNLTRGCSAEGIKGIPPVRDGIIRPLIYCSTQDVLDVCSSEGLDFVTDSTNLDTEYTRNKIRHEIIPILKTVNPSVEKAVTNLCESIRCDTAYLNSIAEGCATDDVHKLAELPFSLQSRILVRMYSKTCCEGCQLSHIHVNEMVHLLNEHVRKGSTEKKTLSLPGKTDFILNGNSFYFEKEKKLPATLENRILKHGLNEFPESREAVILSFSEEEALDIISKNIYKLYTYTIVKRSVTADTITVRGKKEGDVFKYSNMTKKVKKMFNEAKIEVEKRSCLPLFCDKNGIFWIPGIAVRDDVKVSDNEEKAYLYYLRQE